MMVLVLVRVYHQNTAVSPDCHPEGRVTEPEVVLLPVDVAEPINSIPVAIGFLQSERYATKFKDSDLAELKFQVTVEVIFLVSGSSVPPVATMFPSGGVPSLFTDSTLIVLTKLSPLLWVNVSFAPPKTQILPALSIPVPDEFTRLA